MKNWELYEKYVIDRLRAEILDTEKYEFSYKTKIFDSVAKKYREIDGYIKDLNNNAIIPVQAKFHQTKPKLNDIEGFITFCNNINAKTGIFISSTGATESSENIAVHYGITLLHFSLKDFNDSKFLYILPYFFHFGIEEGEETIFNFFINLITGKTSMAIQKIDTIQYESWLEFINTAIIKDLPNTKKLLKEIAFNHYDSGWRFNAIQVLFDIPQGLTKSEVEKIKLREFEPEFKELLEEL